MYLETIIESIILYISLAGLFYHFLSLPSERKNFRLPTVLFILFISSLYVIIKNESYIISSQFVTIKIIKLISVFYLYFKAFDIYKKKLENISDQRHDDLTQRNQRVFRLDNTYSGESGKMGIELPGIELSGIELPERELAGIELIGNGLLDNAPDELDNRYQKSLIPIQEQEQIRKKIETFFEQNENKYLDSDFNLDSLSKHISVPKHEMSQTLSLNMDTTFSNYLNENRINYACNELMKNSTISVVELSEICGYRSRASFYHNFKNVKNTSFAEYRKQFEVN